VGSTDFTHIPIWFAVVVVVVVWCGDVVLQVDTLHASLHANML